MREWNLLCFYYLYHDLEKQCCHCFIWLLPYNLHRWKHVDPRDFIVAEPHVKNNYDLLQRLRCYMNEWSGQIFQALSQDRVLPKEGLSFLQQSNGCGYTFLRYACVLHHPYIMDQSVSLTSTHPHQGPSTSFTDYYVKADFYYNMLGLVKDVRVSLGDTYHQHQATTHCDVHSRAVTSFCHVKGSRQKIHSIYGNLLYCNHVFSLKQVTVQLVSFHVQFLQDKDQGVVWKVSIHFTFLFTFTTLLFGKKHYHFICSGYNPKSILYPIEYDDGDQEHCNLAMATVLQRYDGHVQKDYQSKFIPSPMQF